MAERNGAQAIVAIAAAIVIGAAISWAGSDGGNNVGTIPVFALCGALAYAINWLVFIPSALSRTERYYDLTGGITYISAIVVAVLLSDELDLRAALVAAMVLIWSLRLAMFLFLRISRAGHDARFDDLKTRPLKFLMAWTLQGLWVLLTAAAALAVITGGVREPLGAVGMAGIAVWLVGFVIEIVADRQKSQFKADPQNEGKFVDVGLWAWSRHPNYFGEIVLWTGMAFVAVPVLQGWQWATLISPLFVTVLLTRISGIPLLEGRADKRWGGEKEYEDYKRRTPVLIPKPPARRA
jgi:steroid 5-alpha reductase family enzyme